MSPSDWETITTYEPSERSIARSTVPGYFAVAAAFSFVSVEPLTAVPMSGGAPCRAPAGAVVDESLLAMAFAPNARAATAASAASPW
jgi:hypothetical protein